jgi:hypothetical protein
VNAPSGFALYRPRPVAVRAVRGLPQALGGRPVTAIREEWLVEDLWWTGAPLRRHYFELLLGGGRLTTVFCDLESGDWYEQRAAVEM